MCVRVDFQHYELINPGKIGKFWGSSNNNSLRVYRIKLGPAASIKLQASSLTAFLPT
jgi:hypothetical protein